MWYEYKPVKTHETWKESFEFLQKQHNITVNPKLVSSFCKNHADSFYKKYANMLYWFAYVGCVWFGFTNCEINDSSVTCWREHETGITYEAFFWSEKQGWVPYEMKNCFSESYRHPCP